MIIEEIEISLYIDKFFSNKQILIFFCSLTVQLAHAVGLKRKRPKNSIVDHTNETCFKNWL